jgi:hypothetical protein
MSIGRTRQQCPPFQCSRTGGNGGRLPDPRQASAGITFVTDGSTSMPGPMVVDTVARRM